MCKGSRTAKGGAKLYAKLGGGKDLNVVHTIDQAEAPSLSSWLQEPDGNERETRWVRARMAERRFLYVALRVISHACPRCARKHAHTHDTTKL